MLIVLLLKFAYYIHHLRLVIVLTNHIFVKKRSIIGRKTKKKLGKYENLNYHNEANLKADHFMDVTSRKKIIMINDKK